ncbi:MAG: adenylate/guanylate cyclase domain-containing protein [Spirochaetes bacterium]|nr:adenylate/guanylate cyclase domain-containing protein [Spirochaetota bacterium]
MKETKRKKIFETKYFGMIIALLVFILIVCTTYFTNITDRLDLKMLDFNFYLKNIGQQRHIQQGVTQTFQNPNISPDILIVGIDLQSLNRFGRWPFPRYRHADLIRNFARIQNQEDRERALFLDVFFIEPDTARPYDDALLVEAIKENQRVFLQTVLNEFPPSDLVRDDFITRHEILYDNFGRITNVTGNWHNITTYFGFEPPLQPFARAIRGYGHANIREDSDQIFRRQGLITKVSILIDTINIDDLTVDFKLDESVFERLGWTDKNGVDHPIRYPLTPERLRSLREEIRRNSPPVRVPTADGEGEYIHIVKKYQDTFIPAITLSLAMEYFNRRPEDIKVRVGEYIKIPSPQYFNTETQEWEPYQLVHRRARYNRDGTVRRPEVRRVVEDIFIPIDKHGRMLINFMGPPSSAEHGGHQTFPVRSYSAYAANPIGSDPYRWPRTWMVANRILMVGPFVRGVASDEKTTPFGLMFGIEIHANALNTILMNNFLREIPAWLNVTILFIVIFYTAFITSRFSTLWAGLITLASLLGYFLLTSYIFEAHNYIIKFPTMGMGIFFTFLAIVLYRVMTEERDKKRIKSMFGKYVSPAVVDQILDTKNLELGGVDKNLTVFFSDIRGFTALSESMTPQELVNHLNIYLSAVTDIIMEFNGTLDKYIGDAVMCFWGAPLPQENHAILACKCALKQMDTLRKLNDGWPKEKRINIGIGLNSGIMTVGNMGSLGRMNYTLMGDNVNLAARLEGTTKEYGVDIIISEYTYAMVKDEVVVRELDNIRVKGKNKPVLIYELLDVKGGYDTP